MDDRREQPLTKDGPLRGQIYNRARSNQKNDYSGLIYEGTKTPTDLDGLEEFKNKGYLFIEVKSADNILPIGQRIAIERLIIDTGKNGKESLGLVVEHHIDNPLIDVPVAECPVREYFHSTKQKWIKPKSKVITKDFVFWFFDRLNAKKG